SGKLRALGVANAKRTPVMPNVPTVDEAANLKDFEAVSWYALVGPAGLAREIAARIQSDVARIVRLPEIRDKMLGMGAEPVGSTQEQLVAVMKQDYERYGAIIKRLGIRAD
ncbi:MAG TPA: tripartite tricarboxylate transporter substrate-binding protein, partial [Burkholderiales bacterium]|nr:tripartite tricarboxylate transporter substrate-binding protein [Burkholderiales bacterium]